jgi:uncharacterized protein YcbX
MIVRHLFRHPIKSHGREALDEVSLIAGQSMPWDRVWAIAHDASSAAPGDWAPCANFSRGSKAPALLAIRSILNEDTEEVTLSHPDRPDIALHPEKDADRLVDWVMPLVPKDRARPARVLRLAGRSYTDSDFPSVTLCNLATHRDIETRAGEPLSIHRWRGNIWFDGAAPWEERSWLCRKIAVGDAVLLLREHTERCLATTANPDTGLRDVDTLGLLEQGGHRDFSLRAEVIEGGRIATSDTVRLL